MVKELFSRKQKDEVSEMEALVQETRELHEKRKPIAESLIHRNSELKSAKNKEIIESLTKRRDDLVAECDQIDGRLREIESRRNEIVQTRIAIEQQKEAAAEGAQLRSARQALVKIEERRETLAGTLARKETELSGFRQKLAEDYVASDEEQPGQKQTKRIVELTEETGALRQAVSLIDAKIEQAKSDVIRAEVADLRRRAAGERGRLAELGERCAKPLAALSELLQIETISFETLRQVLPYADRAGNLAAQFEDAAARLESRANEMEARQQREAIDKGNGGRIVGGVRVA